MSGSQVVLGVDLGGTTLRAALFVGGTPVAVATRASALASDERDRPSAVMVELFQQITSGRAIDAVCVAAAGPVDVAARRIHNMHTLPDWSEDDWPDLLSDALQAPVLMENDAMAAAAGEFRAGAGQGADVMCMVMVGTGIGVAVVGSKRGPYRGARSFHPEAGHMLISHHGDRCYCGYVGCWEALCSGTALASRWTTGVGQGSAPEVDWDGYAEEFARGIANLERVYVPDVIVLGGGVADSFATFSSALRAALSARDVMGPVTRATIVKARLEHPGAYGAAHLAMDYLADKERKTK